MKRVLPGLIMLFLIVSLQTFAQTPGQVDAISSGVPWFDQHGKVVSAQGANIIKDHARYYLFGEAHTDTSNAFVGFNCYSSADLYNWKFERVALPVQASGKLGPNRVGERVKVMKCPSTGLYMMYMHVDTLGYKDQFVGYASSTNITGPYTLTAKVKNSGDFTRLEMYALSNGKMFRYRIEKENTSWQTIHIMNVQVSTGKVEIGFFADGAAHAFCQADDISLLKIQ